MTDLQTAHTQFVQGMSRISSFWGLPKAMGAIFGVAYLSPTPVSLDDFVAQTGVSKGAVSTNVRKLERLGLLHRHVELGDRKDYYVAETDFWKVVRGLLRERQKSEFDQALQSVAASLEIVETADPPPDPQLAAFYRTRLTTMKSFFDALDNLVAMIITLDSLRSSAIAKLFGKSSS
ncbi:MAG: hypothetical protein KC425_09955 [Anaerolineales bacterium]|nr:hypothetical protein [Anaerolineales bacterium]